MKRIVNTLIVLALATSFAGCQKQLDAGIVKDDCFEIHATINGADGAVGADGTKVMIEDLSAAGGAVNLWTSTDKFYFICPNPENEKLPFTYEYNIKGVTAPIDDAVFSGTTVPTKWTATEYFAYCPATELRIEGFYYFKDVIPVVQEYVAGGIKNGYIPMVAHGTDWQHLSFTSLVSILHFKVKQTDVTEGAEKVNKIVVDYPQASKEGVNSAVYARGWASTCFFRPWGTSETIAKNRTIPNYVETLSGVPTKTVTLNVPNVPLSNTASDFYIVINAKPDRGHGSLYDEYHRGISVSITTDKGTHTVEKGFDWHFNTLPNHIYQFPEINISGH